MSQIAPITVNGSTLRVGATSGAEQIAESAPSPGIQALASSPDFVQLLAREAQHISELTLDFAGAPDVDLVAKMAADMVLRGSELHSLIRFLDAMGVSVGYQKQYEGAFYPGGAGLPQVDFGSEPPSAKLMPYAMQIQEIVAETKQLANGLAKDGKAPLTLREACRQQARLAQELVAIIVALSGKGKEAEGLTQAAIAAQRNVAEVNNRVFYAMSDYVESQKQVLGIPLESSWPVVITYPDGSKGVGYRNTFREGRPDQARREELAAEMYLKLLKKGGHGSDMRIVDPHFLGSLGQGQLAEYVMVAPKKVGETPILRATTNGDVKHGHMSGLDDAETAGGFRRWLDANGNVALMIINGASGHYRPSVESLQAMRDYMVSIGVPAERIICVGGDMTDPSNQLALDIWIHKGANKGELSKEQGNAYFAQYKAYEREIEQAAQALVAKLEGGAS